MREAPLIASQCSRRGYCDAANVYDYTDFYETAPAQAQAVERHRQALLAMTRGGDFSELRIVREPVVTGAFLRAGRGFH